MKKISSVRCGVPFGLNTMQELESKRQSFIEQGAIILEVFLFPPLFIYFLIDNSYIIMNHHLPQMVQVLQLFNDGLAGLPECVILAQLAKRVILIMFGVVLLSTFVLRKNLLQGPNNFREITLPLLMTFFWMLFNLIGASSLSANMMPEPFLLWTSMAGITLGLIGWIICLISLYNLRYSFGVFVQVRPLVTCGLYRCVRHPIYLGYTIIAIGLLLSWPSISYLVAVPLYIWIMVGRARLEEKKLISYFPAYREYMQNTPFLLPRF